MTSFFHLTPPENVKPILETGLRGNEDGEIYVFTDMLVANVIAKEQVFTRRYAVFAIDPAGITGKVMPETAAEFSAGHQRIIVQDRIAPEYLKLTGEWDTIIDKPTEWDYLVNRAVYGDTREQVDRIFEFLAQQRRERQAE